MRSIEFFHPSSIEEAVSLLVAHEGSRCIAGGQTLVAMMNAGLIEAPALISVAGIDELKTITAKPDGGVKIGASVCHRDVAAHAGLRGANVIIRQAARVIAHPAIRNFGTMGGALAHADPAADYPTAAIAAGGLVEIAGGTERRTVLADEFFIDYFTTTLGPGEIITALVLPPIPPSSVGHYLKFSRVDGDYAIASVAVTLEMENGNCKVARLVIGGCGAVPVLSAEANEALAGTKCDDAAIAAAAEHLVERADPVDDVRGSSAYRLALIPKLLRRAVQYALQSQNSGAGA